MKKFLSIFIIVTILLTSKAQAQTIKVSAVDNFSSANPAPIFRIKMVEDEEVQGMLFKSGTIISGIVLRVYEPARGKRDGYFEFIPTEITYNTESIKINIPKTIARIMYYKPIDAPETACNIARKIANFFLKGAISAIEFADGAIMAENGQRIKSGANKVYNDSFFSYIEPGKELNINKGDIINLKLKTIR